MFDNKVIFEFENKFGSFSVEELTYEGRRARVLFSGPMHAAQSGIALDGKPRLLFDYNQRFLELASELNPRRALILGGGTLTLPMGLISAFSRLKVTAVEINPDLIELAAKYFGYQPDPRLRVVNSDAEKFMRLARPTYELIVVDLYNNFTIPKVFLSRAFATRLKKAMLPGGVVAVNCIATSSGESSAPLKQLAQAFTAEVGPVRVVKADNEYIDMLPQNLIVLSGQYVGGLLAGLTEVKLD